MPASVNRYSDDGLPSDDHFYLRKISGDIRIDLKRYAEALEGRWHTTPAVMSSQTHPQAIYMTGHWGLMSGLVLNGETCLAAGFKFHALTNRISGTSPNRYARCQDHGGRIHTADEMQAKFIEWAEREAEWYKALFGEDVQHTKDWLHEFFGELANPAESAGGASSSSSSSEAAEAHTPSPSPTLEGFGAYLDRRGCSEEYIQAQLVCVQSKYSEYFSDLCESEERRPWPLENPPKNRKIRQSGSGEPYQEVNECLLMPNMLDVLGVYVNPKSVTKALEIWLQYYTVTGIALPLYTYTQGEGLSHAIDSIDDSKLRFYDYLFNNRSELHSLADTVESGGVPDEHNNDLWQLCLESGQGDVIKALTVSRALNPEAKYSEGRTELMLACAGGCLWVVQELLAKSADVNAEDNFGSTPLIWAAHNGHSEAVRALLANGANVNATNKSKTTALILAAQNGHGEAVRVLLENGADPDIQNNTDSTALMLAACNDHLEVVLVLLENRADPGIQDNNGETALSFAAYNGHGEAVRALLANGANVNATNKSKTTALILAAQNGHLDVVKVLIDKGADPDIQNNTDSTALILAACKDHLAVVRLLLGFNGIAVDARDNYGRTALIWAARNNNHEMVRLLLGFNGIAVDAIDNDDSTALMWAAQHGHAKVVHLLLEKGANINAKDITHNTALIRAVQHSHAEVVRLLLGYNGIAVDARDNNGRTALIWAARNNNHEMVRLLLGFNGIAVDAIDNDDSTALIYAARHGYHQVVHALLEKGINKINVNAQNNHGDTALFCAVRSGHHEVVRLLLGQVANINAKDSFGNTALIFAAQNGHLDVVKVLIDKGADINVKSSNGKTALIWAARKDHLDVVSVLLANGADPNIQDNVGDTALILATNQDNYKVVCLLLDVDSINVDAQNKNSETALICAARYDYHEVVRALLNKGADPNIQDNVENTALILALKSCHISYEVVHLLLGVDGINVNAQNKNSETALICAARYDHLEVVCALLKKGADPDIQDNSGDTALILAARCGYLELIKALLGIGAAVNTKNSAGYTALGCAASQCHLGVVDALLNVPGIEVDAQGKEMNAVLIRAAECGSDNIVRALLGVDGIDVNTKDQNGCTALILAARDGRCHGEVVRALLGVDGIDVDAKSKRGDSALGWAARKGNSALVGALLKKSANANVQCQEGKTALMWAVQCDHHQVVIALLEYGANTNIKSDDGDTALIIAARHGRLAMVLALIKEGADVNAQDNNSETALAKVRTSHEMDLVGVLLASGADDRDLPSGYKKNDYSQYIARAIGNQFQQYIDGDNCWAVALLEGYQCLYQEMAWLSYLSFFVPSALDRLQREDQKNGQERCSSQLLSKLVEFIHQDPECTTARVLVELAQLMTRLARDYSTISLCVNGANKKLRLPGKGCEVKADSRGQMLAPFQLPQGSRLSTRDARVIDVMRSSLVKSTFRNHDVSMRDVRFTDIFSTVTDNFSSHQCWVLGKTNSFVTNEYEVHQEHGDGSTTSGKLDLPRDGMQALSKVQVDSPEKSILALFNIASEGVAFRYALMALFFSFKASYAESEYHPSSVILGLVDENCYRVRMWANDGMRAEETAQSDQGESCAATKLQGHRVTLRVELF